MFSSPAAASVMSICSVDCRVSDPPVTLVARLKLAPSPTASKSMLRPSSAVSTNCRSLLSDAMTPVSFATALIWLTSESSASSSWTTKPVIVSPLMTM